MLSIIAQNKPAEITITNLEKLKSTILLASPAEARTPTRNFNAIEVISPR